MRILNCESLESAIASISSAYNTEEKSIARILEATQYPEEVSRRLPWDEHLLLETEKALGSHRPFSKTIWFHLTRCKVGTTFEEGILPLDLALPRIEADLNEMTTNAINAGNILPSPTSPDSHFGYLLSHKNSRPYLRGPFAMLVREIAFVSKQVGNHDYLGIPEAVEDLCYMRSQLVDIKSIYVNATSPCIVKFESDKFDYTYLRAALCYVHAKITNIELGIHCNTCFNAEGQPVLASKIISVEFQNKH